MTNGKPIEPIPEEFGSYEEAAEFWDTHDTTDYPDALRTVDVETQFRGRHYEIEIEADVVEALKQQAKERGIPLRRLASDLLRKQIAARE